MGNTPIVERTVVTAVTPVLHIDQQWASGVTEDLQWQKRVCPASLLSPWPETSTLLGTQQIVTRGNGLFQQPHPITRAGLRAADCKAITFQLLQTKLPLLNSKCQGLSSVTAAASEVKLQNRREVLALGLLSVRLSGKKTEHVLWMASLVCMLKIAPKPGLAQSELGHTPQQLHSVSLCLLQPSTAWKEWLGRTLEWQMCQPEQVNGNRNLTTVSGNFTIKGLLDNCSAHTQTKTFQSSATFCSAKAEKFQANFLHRQQRCQRQPLHLHHFLSAAFSDQVHHTPRPLTHLQYRYIITIGIHNWNTFV
ncbi:hypothetical protein EK904_003444 [Melospiza melodia maxima]|nr:hypothetical protein EK904_003444 [Melospiza melodia maxima]